jgi:hypothetical protein
MEALKVMTDYLDEANKGGPLERSVYFGCAAICSGLMAVVYELRTMRSALEMKRAA